MPSESLFLFHLFYTALLHIINGGISDILREKTVFTETILLKLKDYLSNIQT